MTSVWPALWPPWKRTTTSARSDSQSTTLPLPSSPHWAPTTATFAIVRSASQPKPGSSGGEAVIAQIPESEAPAARPGRPGLPVDDRAAAGPDHAISELDDALLLRLELRFEGDDAALVVEVLLRRRGRPHDIDLDVLVLGHGDLVVHHELHRAFVHVLDRDAEVAAV